MKTRKKVKDYAAVISRKTGLPEKEVKKVLSQFCLNMASKLKEGYDIRLDEYFTIFTNKEARLKYYSIKNKNLNGDSSRGRTETIQIASSKEVDIEREITKIAKIGLISKVEGEEIKKVLMDNKPEDGVQGGSSLWKLAQGVGAVARGKDDRRKRELEEVAGSFIKTKSENE